MRYLIDYPTPFDSLKEWEKFYLSLSDLDASAPEVKSAKRTAEAAIAEKKRA